MARLFDKTEGVDDIGAHPQADGGQLSSSFVVRDEQDRIVYRANLLGILRRRELASVAGQLSGELGLGYVETKSGEKFEGVYRRHVDLASGRLAVIQIAREFTLAPWRPVDIPETLVSAPTTCHLVVDNKMDGQR